MAETDETGCGGPSRLLWETPEDPAVEVVSGDESRLISRSSRVRSACAACVLPSVGCSEWKLRIVDIGTEIEGLGIAIVEVGVALYAGDKSEGNVLSVKFCGAPPEGVSIPLTCSGSVRVGDAVSIQLDMDVGKLTIGVGGQNPVIISETAVDRAQISGVGEIRGHLWQPWCSFRTGRHESIILLLEDFNASRFREEALRMDVEKIKCWCPGHGGQPGPGIHDAQCVLPRTDRCGALFISSGFVANADTFMKLDIGGIVRLGNYQYDVAEHISVLTVAIGDRVADIASHFPSIICFMEEQLCKREQNVLVHCGAGVSRSSASVIAYLMWKTGQGFDEQLAFLKGRREWVRPNSCFEEQLRAFDFGSLVVP
eukprot:TRINITY_DN8156_c0_g1_i2.p1 TRINITY_DN8156_c0_g1~~TRINITY_DN8156_c0_g1_i2.p1  ORF type:complete len:386 (-),score=41.45 TRINITY_DN8156_c0_g1_i2:16-1125(-)